MSHTIWYGNPVLADLEWMNKNTLAQSLDIRITEIGKDFLKGTMPVDERTKQPFGLLHGGASVALAETLGSVASWLVVNRELFIGVGIEINANHVKAVTSGLVTAICKPVHVGGRNHIWDIRITNDKNELCCISRLPAPLFKKTELKNNIL
ncbi:MAG: hotdog fold thioesterase [Bacteroidota bacterium]|nr:hotdog fold thioesterase [Bacteroidota bacterium]